VVLLAIKGFDGDSLPQSMVVRSLFLHALMVIRSLSVKEQGISLDDVVVCLFRTRLVSPVSGSAQLTNASGLLASVKASD
jgi:hypothetical protein